MNTDGGGDELPDPEIGIWGWEDFGGSNRGSKATEVTHLPDSSNLEDLPVGDFGQSKLSPECLSILSDLFDQLEKDHEIKNGTTALWMHVVSVIGSSIDR